MAFIGNCEYRGFGHCRVFVDGCLYLGRVDVLTAAQNHVLGPVDEKQEAVVIQVANVTGVEPPIGQGLGIGLRSVQVTAEHVSAADPQLAVLTRPLIGTVLGHDPSLHDRAR